MAKYRVRSGQNIYDVALTLYGSVEGIFDLLASNRWLNMETQLKYGMELTYHENFVLHADIPMWFNDHKLLVKNGEHICNPIDVESLIKEHIEKEHPDIFASLDEISPDEQISIGKPSVYPEWPSVNKGNCQSSISSSNPTGTSSLNGEIILNLRFSRVRSTRKSNIATKAVADTR